MVELSWVLEAIEEIFFYFWIKNRP